MAEIDRTMGLVGNVAMKSPCRVASTANLTLSGEQTIDGVAAVTGDRVLVKDQTTGTENGIYDVDTGDWNRSQDADGNYDLVEGTMVKVNGGSTASGFWYVTTTGDIVIDSTSIAWARSATVFAVISAYWQAIYVATTQAASLTALGFSAFFQTLIAAANAAALRALIGLDTGDSPTFTGVTATGAVTAATVAGAAVATQAQQETGSATNLIVSPGRQQYHASAAKGWCMATAAGVATVSYNVTSVTDTGTGNASIVWATDFSSGDYCPVVSVSGGTFLGVISTLAAGSTVVRCYTDAGADQDPTNYLVVAFGDQA